MENTKDLELNSYSSLQYGELDDQWAYDKLHEHFQNSRLLVYKDDHIRDFYNLDKGHFSKDLYEKIFTNQNGNKKSKEQFYKNTDFKPCPLIYALLNVLYEQIKGVNHSIEITSQDTISKKKKTIEKQKILSREARMNILNDINDKVGLPRLNFDSKIDKDEDPNSLMATIKREATDNKSLAIIEQNGGLKDGVQMAHEMSINHFIDKLEIKKLYGTEIAKSIIGTNAAALRFYTSVDNGMPKVNIVDPTTIEVNAFDRKDGRDINIISYSYECTFREYLDEIGKDLPIEKNMEVFKAHKNLFNNIGGNNANIYSKQLLNTKINIGYAECKVVSYDKETKKYLQKTKVIYYASGDNQTALTLQGILKIKDLQDMEVFGEDNKNSGLSFIISKATDRGMTTYQILEPELQKLNVLYMEWLNVFSAYIPNGSVFNYDSFLELAKSITDDKIVDENGNDITEERVAKKALELIQKYRHRGTSIGKGIKGEDGTELNSPMGINSVNNGILNDLVGLSQLIYNQYIQMLKSISFNENMVGAIPPPRTSLGAVRSANQMSSIATKYLTETYEEMIIQFGNKVICWDKAVIKEFKNLKPTTYRAKVLEQIVGDYGVNMIELFDDMPEQDASCILEIESTADDFMALYQDAMMMLQMGQIDHEDIIGLKNIKNYKLACNFLIAMKKRKERLALETQMNVNEQTAQQQQQQMAMAQQMRTQEKMENAELEERKLTLENQMKYEGQQQVNAQKTQSKKEMTLLEKQLENVEDETEY